MSETFLWFKTKEPKKSKEKIPKYISPIGKKKNKRGFSFVSLFLLVAAMACLAVIYPVWSGIAGIQKQSDYANCPGYTSSFGTVFSYNASLPSDPVVCPILNIGYPLIVLGVLIIGIGAVVFGGGGSPTPGV